MIQSGKLEDTITENPSADIGLMVFSTRSAPTILSNEDNMPGESFFDGISSGKKPMDLSSYLKSMAFIKGVSPGFSKRMTGNRGVSAMYLLSTILNNVLHTGEVLVADGVPGRNFSLMKANPSIHIPGAICRPCYNI